MTAGNKLHEMRQKRGMAAASLAAEVGISRQTIYAIEAGSYVPNTIVALKLARALSTKVEDLFQLEEEETKPAESLEATLLGGGQTAYEGQPVQLCQVDGQLIAAAPDSVDWSLPPADAVLLTKPKSGGRVEVLPFHGRLELGKRLLVAGCDPGISVLARHLRRAGIELVVVNRNSTTALGLLREGLVHIAGTHLRDSETGESNLAEVKKLFDRRSAAVIGFSHWELGLVVARGNPKAVTSIADLKRKDITIVNREKGAAVRILLDAEIAKLGISPKAVKGYDRLTSGHLPAAMQIHSGAADAAIASKSAARVFGLGFVPLLRERYDLVLRKKNLDMAEVQTLCETLGRASFRQELEAMGGYDTSPAGQQFA
ncbi:molybdate-binding protein/DNA-binding XRE family transcriptional regulator [Rhizomicrobium palustre]|uniref:Molybdate-binding protein/DNA-binding XRE family transcriptional regulator n=1 Tax=Rhizomicrobium palustre TaxID=189966 RepID=A0A846MYV0_9PROT|nr:substrate-binding domain-containing protein [Rhizomicrobium palustre]NIK88395.1 molybdate-binding protein/DNA-binding XRE family transcriptional regulator [Rhizomicrobium palustre]